VVGLDSLFEQAVAKQSARHGTAPVEAEGILVEVVVQVVVTDRALKRAQEPPLQERCDPMHAGHEYMRGAGRLRRVRDPVRVPELPKVTIAGPPIGVLNAPALPEAPEFEVEGQDAKVRGPSVIGKAHPIREPTDPRAPGCHSQPAFAPATASL